MKEEKEKKPLIICQNRVLEVFIDVSKYLTHEAGAFVKNIHLNNKVKVKKKGELKDTNLKNGIMDDPITNADKLSNYILLYGFNIVFPKLNIVSEEKLVIPSKENIDMVELNNLKLKIKNDIGKKFDALNHDLKLCKDDNNVATTKYNMSDFTMWLDPLDATKEYSEHDPGLVKYISIMSCMAYKGKPISGLIYFPFTTRTYWTYKLKKSANNAEEKSTKKKSYIWKNSFQDIPSKQLHRPETKTKVVDGKVKTVIDLIYSRSHDGGVVEDVNKLEHFTVDKSFKAAGSGYKMTQVALDGIDAAGVSSSIKSNDLLLYAHNTKIKKWDVCAGDAILKSMNGMTTTWDGKEIDYSYGSSKIIKNGLIAVKYNSEKFRNDLYLNVHNYDQIHFNMQSYLSLFAIVFVLLYILNRFRHRIRMGLMSLYRNENNNDIIIPSSTKESNKKPKKKNIIYKFIDDIIQFLLYGSRKKNRDDDTNNNRLEKRLELIKRDVENGATATNDKANDRKDSICSSSSGSSSSDAEARKYYRSLMISALGLQGCYLLWGICQENIMSQEFQHTVFTDESHYFKHSQFIVFSNRLFAFSIAFIVHMYQINNNKPSTTNDNQEVNPWPPFYLFSLSSLSNSLSSYCQYEALKYLSFPFHVVFKSSKLIPVMLMGYVINRKVYKRIEYVASIFISFGIYIFLQGGGQGKNKKKNKMPSTSSSSSTSSSHQIDTASVNIGIFLMLLYITFDAFTSNWQSKLFKKHKVTKMQLMIGINFWSTLLIFTSITSSGEIFDAIVFFQTHHINAFYSLIILCLSGALGQFFIYHTIKTFGPLIFSIIMATRQIFSIVLSCIIFQHTLNNYAILGSIIVFLSIGMRIYYK